MPGFCRPVFKPKPATQRESVQSDNKAKNDPNHEKQEQTSVQQDSKHTSNEIDMMTPAESIVASLKKANVTLDFDPAYLMDDDLWFNILFRQRNLSKTLSINDLWYKHISPLRVTEEVPPLSEWKGKYEEQVEGMDEPARRVLLAVIIRHFLLRGIEVKHDRKILLNNNRFLVPDLLESRFYSALVIAMQMVNPRRSKQFLISTCSLLEGDISENLIPVPHLIGKNAKASTKNREKMYEKLCSRSAPERAALILVPIQVSLADQTSFNANRERERVHEKEREKMRRTREGVENSASESGTSSRQGAEEEQEQEEVQLDEETLERMREYLNNGMESEELLEILRGDIEEFALPKKEESLSEHIRKALLAEGIEIAVPLNTGERGAGTHHHAEEEEVVFHETMFDENAFLDIFYLMSDDLLGSFEDDCEEGVEKVAGSLQEAIEDEADETLRVRSAQVEVVNEDEIENDESDQDYVMVENEMTVESANEQVEDENTALSQQLVMQTSMEDPEEGHHHQDVEMDMNCYTEEDLMEIFDLILQEGEEVV
jgi:hypothetical protein